MRVVAHDSSRLRHANGTCTLAGFESYSSAPWLDLHYSSLPLRSFLRRIYLLYVLALLRLTCTLPLALILAPVHTPQINLLPPPRLQLQRTISAVIRKSRIGRSHTHHTLSPTPVPLQPHIL